MTIDSPNLNQLIRQEDWERVVSLIEAGADIHVVGVGELDFSTTALCSK